MQRLHRRHNRSMRHSQFLGSYFPENTKKYINSKNIGIEIDSDCQYIIVILHKTWRF
jgi:hypothetical protein